MARALGVPLPLPPRTSVAFEAFMASTRPISVRSPRWLRPDCPMRSCRYPPAPTLTPRGACRPWTCPSGAARQQAYACQACCCRSCPRYRRTVMTPPNPRRVPCRRISRCLSLRFSISSRAVSRNTNQVIKNTGRKARCRSGPSRARQMGRCFKNNTHPGTCQAIKTPKSSKSSRIGPKSSSSPKSIPRPGRPPSSSSRR
mmetsp:Transcript_42179/g.127971  ORF Transcript_42179/g.127971 Transcript_42179/m.127971 type:complete len:200 (+) Transcript_42179:349-948(+)